MEKIKLRPCPKCAPSGGTHQIIPGAEYDSAARCDCPLGKSLSAGDLQRKMLPVERVNFRPKLAAKTASQAVRALTSIPGVPYAEEAQTIIASEMRHLCNTIEEARWLVRRMTCLYSKWPGIREMRMVFCSKFFPADGLILEEFGSEIYPGGIPSETSSSAPPLLALPPGHVVTIDIELDKGMKKLAEKTKLDKRRAIR